MSKSPKRIDPHPRQRTLLELLTAPRAWQGNGPGSMNVREPLRQALTQALKECPLSRHQVAGEMSHLLNEEISKAMLDSWTAESKIDRRLPAEFLAAFCEATDCDRPAEVTIEPRRLYVVPKRDALENEIASRERRLKGEEKELRKLKELLRLYGQVCREE